MLIRLFITLRLKDGIERSVSSGLYPQVDLENIGKTSIQLATLNEELWVEPTVRSLIEQKLYQQYHNKGIIELVLADSYSEDRTVEIAQPYVDRVLHVNRGKITARGEAIEQSEDADIIVSVDSGDIYPQGYLNLLLRHFSDPEVVAVSGSKLLKGSDKPVYYKAGIIWMDYLVTNHLWGDAMAMRRDAFFACGGWDESVAQQDIKKLWVEEEVNLYRRMSEVGKVVNDKEAVAYDTRTRFSCGGRYESDEIRRYCEEVEKGKRF